MPLYIIRLDDACPTMNHEKWDRVEQLFDSFHIKPLVGVIPDNQDTDFQWPIDKYFWEKVQNWQKKGWEIALHGVHHKYHEVSPGSCFQKTHGTHSEFTELPLETQEKLLEEGLTIFRSHHINTHCFYAPAHNYDANTVKALKTVGGGIRYISDGYALRPFQKNGMTFVPSVCDGPFRMPFGIFTYVFHPSYMSGKEYKELADFIKAEYKNVIPIEKSLKKIQNRQGFVGCMLEYSMYLLRGIRNYVSK